MGGALRREPGSHRRPGPRSCRCRAGEGFGMEGRALQAGLEMTPGKCRKKGYCGKNDCFKEMQQCLKH